MFGYATNETAELMPAPIFYAHKILRLISEARHSGVEKVLGPDSKSQVTVQYEKTASRSACAKSSSRISISSRT